MIQARKDINFQVLYVYLYFTRRHVDQKVGRDVMCVKYRY